MEPHGRQEREYIATLCALSTIGASATGLTFGFKDDARPTLPQISSVSNKRKALGSTPASSQTPAEPSRSGTVRRVVSQPASLVTPTDGDEKPLQRSKSRLMFRRRTLLEVDETSSSASNSTISRGSSVSRHRRLLSRAGEPNGDGTNSANTSSSWLRRISMTSTNLNGSPASSRPDTPSISLSNVSAKPVIGENQETSQLTPNKLVKRSFSHRALSSENTRLLSLRRPATSHQRTVEIRQVSLQAPIVDETFSDDHVWRPYFDNSQVKTGSMQARKRHTAGATRDVPVRTISDTRGQHPTLLLGTSVAPRGDFDDLDDISDRQTPVPLPGIRHRKRTDGRRDRRAVTDPVLHQRLSPQMTFERSRSSPLSPISNQSTFEIELPHGTPAFSDPATASSDNVFTDEDSLDFQSDTAYDSLATRATASSHSGLRGLQIGTMFDGDASNSISNTLVGLEELIEGGALDKRPMTQRLVNQQLEREIRGTQPKGFEGVDDDLPHHGVSHSATPPKMAIDEDDEFAATPIPRRIKMRLADTSGPPPAMPTAAQGTPTSIHEIHRSIEATGVEINELDWDKATDPDSSFDDISILPDMPTSHKWTADSDVTMESQFHSGDMHTRQVDQKPSIFDWSEHHRYGGDFVHGSSPRPKTVHGKQSNDPRGSRAAGRRGPSAVHLRSQSVPVARDSNVENDLPIHTGPSKFGTWGLGNKGPSEEWSDDFEFDDNDETGTLVPADPSTQNGSVRGMKVPQSIIDRQASVHGQFGQVQEFMLLVEELKRLRLQGSILQLLNTQSRQLWEDADAIINLATLNDDEEDFGRPQSPTSPASLDAFEEETAPPSQDQQQSVSKIDHIRSRTSAGRRSISSPSTPPSGRPRGESLAHAKNFLQTIHQKRTGPESSPANVEIHQQKKLPFDTQDLRDLVTRAGVITRALKEIIRRAEGVAVSPTKSPPKFTDPAFSQIFHRSDGSPSLNKPGLPKSRSANSYLGGVANTSNENDLSGHMQMLAVG